jgi:K(+)-stimulated pyrophosphate-energized sodium pump
MSLNQILFLIAPIGASLGLVFAYVFYLMMKKAPEGSDRMKEIAAYVREGAKAYISQQYKVVSMFFVCAFIFFAFLAYVLHVQSAWTPIAFLTGGFFSGLSGYLGMTTATFASNRTTEACRHSLNAGLKVAFRSGAVMGLVVVGLGLLDISIWFVILNKVMHANISGAFHVKNLTEITIIMLTFGMGASFQALFARVGGGIFTKAADVGADLVGKIEAGIPEDDPRNPATIADNVGDNVGDVAGMGADLYESYCGSILSTATLGAAAFATVNTALQIPAVILPMTIAGVGVVASVLGIFIVRSNENASQLQLLKSLSHGINLSSLIITIASFLLVKILLPGYLGVFGSILSGLLAGIIIGKSTEYYTSSDHKPTKEIADQALTGPATVIISGISTGMLSTGIPVITVSIAIFLSYGFGNNWHFSDIAMGLYGIGIAAVGMLSTLGITLATDAYGPIADNAGGNAQMSNLDEEVRKRTDALDSLGNTTAATGKGFAIGSAALTAMALLAAYIDEVRVGLERMGQTTIEVGGQVIQTANATINDFMQYYDITLINPKVLIGLFIGSMSAFVFCALTMKAVGRAAGKMVDEVRRQFRVHKGIMEGTETPDYRACVNISTKAAQKEMVLPSLLALIIPVITGILLGVTGVMGLLAGAMTAGFTLAVMLNNAGGAWDNAKKYIEGGQHGGKGSEPHKATVIGDTVGDPFKDTSGPSLNILIKLMSMISIVVAGLTVKYALEFKNLDAKTTNPNKIQTEQVITDSVNTQALPGN